MYKLASIAILQLLEVVHAFAMTLFYNLDFLLTFCIVWFFLCMINIINDKDLFLEKKNPCYSKTYMYVFTQCRSIV